MFEFLDKVIEAIFCWGDGSYSRTALAILVLTCCLGFLVVLIATGMAYVVCLFIGQGL